ncbi:MAG TPA: hypothetical protein VFJ74_15920 [Gemmatimonadaceae bacterium]|nr:hypothetical protein [Gemmatimonadaceae bacterium]
MASANPPRYLERYLAGEHVAVWDELLALGADVRKEPVYSDARAVARETMTRVRHNVELLATRLRELGFRFTYPDEVVAPPDADIVARLDRIEAEAGGPLPIALRAFFEHVGSVCLMGSHPRLSSYAGSPDVGRLADAAAAVTGNPTPPPNLPPPMAALFAGPQGKALGGMMGMMQQLMGRMREVREDMARAGTEGEVPERMRENSRMAESLQAGLASLGLRIGGPGTPSAAAPTRDLVSDPLVVWAPEDDDITELRELGDPNAPEARDDEGWTGRYRIEIAPDALHKANVSGGDPYAVAFPDPAADAPVLGLDAPYARTVVGYLRECFRWGGFPGLATEPDQPDTELARLTEGLLAI